MKINAQFVEAQVGRWLDALDKEVRHLASDYRLQVLIPFCRRHKLTYVTGMGRMAFFDERRRQRPVDARDKPMLRPIEEVLNTEVRGENDMFGFYIEDINRSDIGLR